MRSPTLRCVIVGFGSISRYMLPFLQQQPWFELAGTVEVNDSLAAALPGCDAVIINTPAELHYTQCREALQAGKHVLVAKPITTNFAQAVELVGLAKQQGVTLAVGQQMRYNRHYTAVRRFVESGKIGNVEAVWLMNSKPRPKPGNLGQLDQPALYEMACHHFDSLLAILGEPVPEWIVADGFRPSWSPYAGPCMVNALVELRGGIHVSYHGGFSAQAPMYELRLEGTKGALRCRGIHMSHPLMTYDLAATDVEEGVPADDPFVPFLGAWHAYVTGGPAPSFSGRNNLKVFAMLGGAIESVQTGRRVAIADNPRYACAF